MRPGAVHRRTPILSNYRIYEPGTVSNLARFAEFTNLARFPNLARFTNLARFPVCRIYEPGTVFGFVEIGPYGNEQVNRVLADWAPIRGFVDVWSDRDDALYTCYGSVLDNHTSDPTTVLPR